MGVRAMGHCPPLSFGNSVHCAASARLTVKISKSVKEKHVLHFYLSRQKHSKTHINRLKQSQNQKKIQGKGGEEKFMSCPPHLISWGHHWAASQLTGNRWLRGNKFLVENIVRVGLVGF